jgi:hypothetical protein
MERWQDMKKSLNLCMPADKCRAMEVTAKKWQNHIHHVTQGEQKM